MSLIEYYDKCQRTCPDLGSFYKNQLHMYLGVYTEVGELLDAFKKYLVYGKPFDLVNVSEEFGDICWYMFNELAFLTNNHPDSREKIVSMLNQMYTTFTIIEERGKEKNDDLEDLSQGIMTFLMEFNDMDFPTRLSCLYKLLFELNLNIGNILEKNISKLQIRYPEKFTQELAINRNIEAEREVL